MRCCQFDRRDRISLGNIDMTKRISELLSPVVHACRSPVRLCINGCPVKEVAHASSPPLPAPPSHGLCKSCMGADFKEAILQGATVNAIMSHKAARRELLGFRNLWEVMWQDPRWLHCPPPQKLILGKLALFNVIFFVTRSITSVFFDADGEYKKLRPSSANVA